MFININERLMPVVDRECKCLTPDENLLTKRVLGGGEQPITYAHVDIFTLLDLSHIKA